MTPDEWLASFESKVADVRQKAAEFKENLERAGATESSADGSLRVTVAPNGALTELSIGDSAMRGSGEELAERIMNLARRARHSAAVQVAAAFAPLTGADPAPRRMPAGYPPAGEDEPEEAGNGAGRPGYGITGPGDPEPATRPAAAPGQRRSAPGDDDDEDFGADQIFGRRDEW